MCVYQIMNSKCNAVLKCRNVVGFLSCKTVFLYCHSRSNHCAITEPMSHLFLTFIPCRISDKEPFYSKSIGNVRIRVVSHFFETVISKRIISAVRFMKAHASQWSW